MDYVTEEACAALAHVLGQAGFEGASPNPEISLLDYFLLYHKGKNTLVYKRTGLYDGTDEYDDFHVLPVTTEDIESELDGHPGVLRTADVSREEWLWAPKAYQIFELDLHSRFIRRRVESAPGLTPEGVLRRLRALEFTV